MLKNYLVLTLRRIWRNKMYAGITILGLSVGFACFGILISYVWYEQSYEDIHKKHDRIYRVAGKLEFEGQGEHSSSCPFPVGPTLYMDYPQLVENYTRLFNFQEPEHVIKIKDKIFSETNLYLADTGFFSVFDYKFLYGDAHRCLEEPNCIVLTEELAEKYFHKKNVLGEQLLFDGQVSLKVTGVVKTPKGPSHIKYDGLISFFTIEKKGLKEYKNWVWNPCWTYILFKPGINPSEMEKQFPAFVKKHYPDFLQNQVTHELQSLKSIHLESHLDYEMAPNGNYWTLFIVAITGILILVIACINYINVTIAEIPLRLKEIAIRKIVGASPADIRKQVLYESLIIITIGFCISLALYEVIIKMFAEYFPADMMKHNHTSNTYILFNICAAVFSVAVSHFYPAFILNNKIPSHVLKNNYRQPVRAAVFSAALVGFQFLISLTLIYATIIVKKQSNYLQERDTGFNKDRLLVVPVRPQVADFYLKTKEELRKINGVENVTICNDVIGSKHNTHEFNYDPMPQGKWKYIGALFVDENFIPTMNIKLLAGRNFSKAFPRDDSLAVIINESMLNNLNCKTPEEAIGKRLNTITGSERVVGVVKDFNTDPLQREVGPFVLDISPPSQIFLWSKYVYIKCKSQNIQPVVEAVRKTWNNFTSEFPFTYFMLEDNLVAQYKSEESVGSILAGFSIISIIIAVIGLFNLVSFTIEQKIKEIGIRKVLGASVKQILQLFLKRFLPVMLISFIISVPLCYLLSSYWLEQFAYHFEPGIPEIIIPSLIVSGVLTLTIILRTYKAAIVNPVKSLRYE